MALKERVATHDTFCMKGNVPLKRYNHPTIIWNSKFVVKRPFVSFSSCQRNLIKTFQIEGMIALITKMTLIFSSDLLNGQK